MKKISIFTKNTDGMTLIELMVVIAIVGISASIAYPLYNEQSRKKNRVMAVSSLLQARAQIEKCFLNNQNNFYDGCTFDATKSIDRTKLYKIKVTLNPGVNATSYLLTANKNKAGKDLECSSFSINNAGIKSSTGTGSLQRCWSQ